MSVVVRPATADDLAAAARIYGHYVSTSHCTFELEPPALQHWQHWFRDDVEAGPYAMVVAEADGVVAGYAKTGRFRDRRAYDPSIEVSVYCDPESTARGVGTALYEDLFARIDGRFHRAYAGIALPNTASIALHQRFGFHLVGTYREVGRKFDRWWDVAWYEKKLD